MSGTVTQDEEKAMAKTELPPNTPGIASPKEWDAARERLLVKEKELTHAREVSDAGEAAFRKREEEAKA
jgi:predicted dithiol-disulfide oxidoreductase (DUF899 family)